MKGDHRRPENVKLAQELKAKGLTNLEIAQELNCSRNTVPYLLDISSGKARPLPKHETHPHVVELQRLTAYWLTRPMGAV